MDLPDHDPTVLGTYFANSGSVSAQSSKSCSRGKPFLWSTSQSSFGIWPCTLILVHGLQYGRLVDGSSGLDECDWSWIGGFLRQSCAQTSAHYPHLSTGCLTPKNPPRPFEPTHPRSTFRPHPHPPSPSSSPDIETSVHCPLCLSTPHSLGW